MSHYRVCFFKTLLSSDGHQFKCLQQRLDVLDAPGAEEATKAASRQFEQLHHLRNWTQLADSIEIESADL